MSSWVRDMAMKPPQRPASMPVLDSPTLMISEPGPVRVFDLPNTRRIIPPPSSDDNTNSWRLPEPFSSPSRNASTMRTFDNPTRIKFGQTVNRGQPKQPEQWTKIETVKRKSAQQQEAPAVTQLDRPSNPNVTIVMESSKDIEYLEASLQSLGRQTYSKWVGLLGLRTQDEDTLKSVNASLLKLQLGNVFKVVVFADNDTPADALSSLISQASTQYIAFSSSTDLWVAKKLDQQVQELEANPETGIVGSMSRYFGDRVELAKVPPGTLKVEDFKNGNPVVFPSVVMRRDLAVMSGEFANFEFDCWVRNIANNVNIVNLTQILTLQRVNNSKYVARKDDKDEIRVKYNI
jgi:hypothetical protein